MQTFQLQESQCWKCQEKIYTLEEFWQCPKCKEKNHVSININKIITAII